MSVFSEIDTMKNIDVEEEENVMVLPRSDNSVSTNEPLTPEVLSELSKEEKVKTPEVLLSLIRKLRKRKKNLLICFHCWEVVTNVTF